MTLAVNSVVEYEPSVGTSAQRLAILWIHPDGSSGWAIDLADAKSWPTPFDRNELERDIEQGFCSRASPNFFADAGNPSKSEAEQRELRSEAIRPAVKSEPAIYDPAQRAAFIRAVAESGSCSLNTARSWLQAYWRGGKSYSALAPRFSKRGGRGILREPGEKKLGRPRSKLSKFLGLNLNREQKRAVVAVSRAQFRRTQRHSLVTCHKMWLDRLFYEDGIDGKGRPARVPRPEFARTGVPSLEQFKRIYYSLTDVIETKRNRSPRQFALNYRPLTGTATAETWGPGSRFLIDATMADIYLVSRDNRNRIVGRPVLYVVIDVWSRLIVGIYVALEDASWTSAMMALANAACSKVEFCADHGIEIGEDEWPAANIGARLLSDHGEVDGKTAANLALHFNRVVEVAAAYRGDLKGLVETQFNIVQVQFGQFVPGYVAKDYGKRGGRDYRLDAVLDVHEFTATIIDLVLERNSKTLQHYDRDQGMPGDVVRVAPIELWHWGMQHRSGRSQAWPEEYVRFRLMPTAVVRVDRNGIGFQGRSYVGPSIHRMMTQARMGQGKSVTISFDPRVTDVVYLHSADAEHGFEACELHEKSRAYANRTGFEADQDRQCASVARRDAQTADVTRSINVSRRLEERVAMAAARKVADPDTPKSHKVRDIRDNRRSEKTRTKSVEGAAFRPSPDPKPETATVIPFPGTAADDFAESGLSDFIGRSERKEE